MSSTNACMLEFLADLREHNSLDWMHANEKQKKQAQAAFVELVQDCIDDLAETEPELAALDPKSLCSASTEISRKMVMFGGCGSDSTVKQPLRTSLRRKTPDGEICLPHHRS